MTVGKPCAACRVIKPLSDFHKSKRAKIGYASYCKKCMKRKAQKMEREGKRVRGVYNNPSPTVDEKACPQCKKIKSAENFDKNKNTPTGLSSYCKECLKVIRRKRR